MKATAVTRVFRIVLPLAGALFVTGARAYGVEGHLLAGAAAERHLCPSARSQIAALGGGQGLGELGLWADRVRSTPEHAQSAPWHYVNVDDGGRIEGIMHVPEGDVLWAIEHFRGVLADASAPADAREDALRFLVHFIVDLHQPLHVGRASDRGGNAIELRIGGVPTNLHRFWDTDAVALAGISMDSYLEVLLARIGAADAAAGFDPGAWAAESLALREAVYDFDPRARTLTGIYIDRAVATTQARLALAAGRLAATLNGLFCG
jgi:hypothetical protein